MIDIHVSGVMRENQLRLMLFNEIFYSFCNFKQWNRIQLVIRHFSKRNRFDAKNSACFPGGILPCAKLNLLCCRISFARDYTIC